MIPDHSSRERPIESFPDPSPPPIAVPPTTPRPLRAPPAGWPTPFGVVCIVLGALGVFWGGLSALTSGVRPHISVNGASIDQAQRAAAPYVPWLLAAHATAAIVALLLLFAGCGLIARRRWSIRPLAVWAVVKLLLTPAVAVPTFLAQNATQQAVMSGMPGINRPGAAIGTTVASVMLVAVAAISCLWGWALPIFTLGWFARPKIKADIRAFR